MEGFKNRTQLNVKSWNITHPRIEKILSFVLPHIALILMTTSVFMIFTHSVIPKITSLLGFVGFMILNQHPNYRFVIDLEILQETLCIIGGMLCLMGMDKKPKKKMILTEREI